MQLNMLSEFGWNAIRKALLLCGNKNPVLLLRQTGRRFSRNLIRRHQSLFNFYRYFIRTIMLCQWVLVDSLNNTLLFLAYDLFGFFPVYWGSSADHLRLQASLIHRTIPDKDDDTELKTPRDSPRSTASPPSSSSSASLELLAHST